MARPKRSSIPLEKAERRAASLQSISSDLDFGNGLTLEAYNSLIEDLRSQITAYNTILSTIDQARENLQDTEHRLTDFSERMLTGVATQYGKNSTEYTMAGGIRRSERKPKPRKAPSPVESVVQSVA